VLHRNERSGTLHGLLRTQHIQQDDAHIFVTEEQIADEYERIFDIADRFYRIFGLEYRLRLGTRPTDYIGDVETWERAEQALHGILERRMGAGNYLVADGDGAFYGPKVDILMKDALGRDWQMGTIQLDFQLPRRFDCTYTGADNAEHTPVVIHRVIYGSLERFIGILIEETAGAFPVWLSPEQARIIPVLEAHGGRAAEVLDELRDASVRADIDSSERRLGARIRSAQLMKIPFALVIGDREIEEGTVSVRERGGTDHGSMSVEDFAAHVRARAAEELAV
jgi:threonyl-tRNA synthetase